MYDLSSCTQSAKHITRLLTVLLAVIGISGCAGRRGATAPSLPLPIALVGDFVDDYGIAYAISPAEWFQRPQARYRIVRVDTVAGYLIAQNGEKNPSERGLWSRIDWVKLPSMAPFEWAFCLSAFGAVTQEAAEAVTLARRETPRTGCNGHPFSRMRRATPADTVKGRTYIAPSSTPRSP